MDCIFPGDIWLSQFLQSAGDWLTGPMKFFTWLGYPQAYMIIVAVIYWSVDRKLGLRLAIFLPLIASLNSILKQAIHAPRPYWLDQGVRAIHVSNGFGMPSGHAQASTVWLYAAALLKRGWFWAMALIIVLMIGLSRIYLGVHFTSQVIIGWLIGVFVLIVILRIEPKVLFWFQNKRLNMQLLIIGVISTLILILGGFSVFIHRNWAMPAQWINNASGYFTGTDESILLSLGMDAIAGNAGAFMGTAIGTVLLHRRGGFDPGAKVWKRILTSITGLVLCFCLYEIVVLFTPDQTSEVLYTVWRFFGFFVISFSAIFLIPLILIRMHLLSPLKGS